MKLKLVNYAHESNGLAIQVVPETDAEAELLRGIWSHGRMETGHPCGEGKGGTGFYIKAYKATQNEPTP